MKASTLAHGPTLHGHTGIFHMDSYQPATIVSGLYHNVPYCRIRNDTVLSDRPQETIDYI